MENRKKWSIQKSGICLMGLMIILVFFSNTIYSYNQPEVVGVLPKSGKLKKSVKATGTVRWAHQTDIYSKLPGIVSEVLVKDGDILSKGQVIMRMSYDRDEIERKLSESDTNRKKISLEIENINMKIQRTQKLIQDLENEQFEEESISRYDIEDLIRQIGKAEGDYQNTNKLYEAGALPKADVDKALYDLESLKKQLAALEEQLADKQKLAQEKLNEKEKERQKQLDTYRQEIIDSKQQLKSKSLDIETMAQTEAEYRKQLAKMEDNLEITAPDDGVVTNLNVKGGQYIPENHHMATIGSGSGREIECSIPKDNNFVTVGDSLKISNADHSTEAIVTKITPDENGKTVLLSFESDEINPGETFNMEFQKESDKSYTLVPNETLNMDKDGYFVYRIARREGIVGKEYYAFKNRVDIGDSDNTHTQITKGIDFFEPIVSASNKSFEENDPIKVKNASDFFEK